MRALATRLDLPPLWLAAFVALAWAGPRVALGPLAGLFGWMLVALALGVMFWAAGVLWRAGTPVLPGETPLALVTGGPFRWSRNPIYLADLLALAGVGLILGAVLTPVLLPAFQQLLLRRFIRPEEARLATAKGAEFAAYRARVRRWI